MADTYQARASRPDILLHHGPAITAVCSEVLRFAPYDLSVLITGETGTGKELVARHLHYHSKRNHKPFVPLCATSMCDSLLESQVFGHERGAFSGAVKDNDGYLERANKGTLFLDEIGSASPRFQEVLLRVLEEHVYEKVGGYFTHSSDFRLIAATNIDLRKAVAEGRFREDLLYRLDVARIEVPPLRERREDIPELAEHFLSRCRDSYRRPRLDLSEAARDALVDYYWPGNVRELRNTIERAALVADRMIEPEHLYLPEHVSEPDTNGRPLAEAVESFERSYVMLALQQCNGVVSEAADALQVSRKGLYQRMERLGIKPSDYRR